MSALNSILQALGRFFRWWVYVNPWERCIRVRAGARLKELGPGIHFLAPFLDRAFVHSVRLRMSNLPAQTVQRGADAITVRGVLGYRIKDLTLLYREVHDAEDAILDRTAGVLTGKIRAGHTAEDIALAMRQTDFSDWGIEFVSFTITDRVQTRRVYRLVTDKITEHPWSGKLVTSGDGTRGRGH